MKKLFNVLVFITLTHSAWSQIHEFGLFAGGTNFIGDVGSKEWIKPNALSTGLVYKYNINPRIAFRGRLSMVQLKADDQDSKNEVQESFGLNFKSNTIETALGVEVNFFEYDFSDPFKNFTPYFSFEVAMLNFEKIDINNFNPAATSNELKKSTAFSIPIGIGFKTKLFGKIAAALEVRAHYHFSDDLDSGEARKLKLIFDNHPNAMQFNNEYDKDWYVFTGISLVYTFGRPSCYNKSF